MKPTLIPQVVAILLVILILIWGGYNFIFKPKIHEINLVQNQLNEIDLEIKQKTPAEVIFKGKGKGLKKELEEAIRKIPSEDEVPELLDQLISNLGKDLEINYSLLQPQPLIDEGQSKRLPLNLNFSADYVDLNLYLGQLENFPTAIRVESLKINRAAETQKLDIQLSLSAYVMAGKRVGIEKLAAPVLKEGQALIYDPFTAKLDEKIALDKKEPQGKPTLKLKGVYQGAKPRAFIDEQMVGLGETIDGYKLVGIYADKVIVSRNNMLYTLTMEGK